MTAYYAEIDIDGVPWPEDTQTTTLSDGSVLAQHPDGRIALLKLIGQRGGRDQVWSFADRWPALDALLATTTNAGDILDPISARATPQYLAFLEGSKGAGFQLIRVADSVDADGVPIRQPGDPLVGVVGTVIAGDPPIASALEPDSAILALCYIETGGQ